MMLSLAYVSGLECIEILEKDMDHEDAVEYFSFNIIGSWHGEGTSVFITGMEKE